MVLLTGDRGECHHDYFLACRAVGLSVCVSVCLSVYLPNQYNLDTQLLRLKKFILPFPELVSVFVHPLPAFSLRMESTRHMPRQNWTGFALCVSIPGDLLWTVTLAEIGDARAVTV